MSKAVPKQFRFDINGLRAWAVIAVILYHFGIPGFGGGYVGVDIFFVISGLLMTQIIVTGLETNTFSYRHFILSRAKRIFPALAVLCIALVIFGWFWLSTIDYQKLGTHIVGTALFISNHKFNSEAGYFDVASHEKWLLHTWSLSVEWQFYLLLPLMLALAWRICGARGVMLGLSSLLIVSLGLSIYMVRVDLSAAFYLLPYRAWEMLAGGLVWWLMRHRQLQPRAAIVIEILGLSLILLAILGFNANMPWPGENALVPVLGTMLVLAASRQKSILTVNPVATRVGLISYSLYLWHWPIVVFLGYSDQYNNVTWIIGGLLLTLLLSELSYRVIETSTRRRLNLLGTKRAAQILFGVLLLTELSAVGIRHLQVDGRLPEAVELASRETFNRNPRLKECLLSAGRDITQSPCKHGEGELKAVVVGDSHANAVVSSVVAAAGSDASIEEMSYNACPTLQGARLKSPGSTCHQFNEQVIKYLSHKSDVPVILVARITGAIFGYNERHESKSLPTLYFGEDATQTTEQVLKAYEEDQLQTVCLLSQYRPVYLMRPIPEMGVDVPQMLYRKQMFSQAAQDIYIDESDYHRRHDAVWRAQDKAVGACGAKILDPLPYLCHDGRCMGSLEGRPLYFDSNHLSEYGNKLLVPMFEKIFKN
ncbi:acyltransferase [Shewanella alkalitolerans]|uniref:acyltransferase family protein n=1 Tax=Shewanella alkalitolerans TaxID=2864209 RepID=UPI001C65C18F|nr:acyltransferase family protein [Shewanella alkalitolerans]QYJ97617.1 acyltransferase [Shewanella alkalitolerans]